MDPDLSPADICRRAVMRAFGPASVLIDSKNACLYHHGGTRDYLGVATGPASHDLLEMAGEGMRATLRAAILRARREKARVAVSGGSTSREGVPTPFQIDVRAADDAGELLLVSFVDTPESRAPARSKVHEDDASRIAELEEELENLRAELRGAISELETSGEDQKVVNEEALSFNEEYQSTNEELVTSKEELQAFNEELAALNGQLQETLEKQRTTSIDLQNVLYSTDVATLFLDADLKIRFFTPATKAVFNVIASDVGRPLDDLKSLVSDDRLEGDIQQVLHDLAPIEQEVEGRDGIWFVRRILPYKGHDGSVAGVVMTFTDVTGRKHDSSALEEAKRQAEQATMVKSRFLAAASHDLRQPLQTLSLIQGLLAKTVNGGGADGLVVALADTLAAMGGMLDTLLDVNQIEAGTVRLDVVSFPVVELLNRLRDEFAYHAEAHNLSLHVVASSHCVVSDRSLLERMVRNLLSNALKYTTRGKVLLGCRRRGGVLRIEIWDTGSGIAERDLGSIFAEYHQLGNPARERSRATPRTRPRSAASPRRRRSATGPAVLQPLGEQADAGPIPVDQLHPIGALGAERRSSPRTDRPPPSRTRAPRDPRRPCGSRPAWSPPSPRTAPFGPIMTGPSALAAPPRPSSLWRRDPPAPPRRRSRPRSGRCRRRATDDDGAASRAKAQGPWGATTAWTNRPDTGTSSATRPRRRHVNSCWGVRPCRRATAQTESVLA